MAERAGPPPVDSASRRLLFGQRAYETGLTTISRSATRSTYCRIIFILVRPPATATAAATATSGSGNNPVVANWNSKIPSSPITCFPFRAHLSLKKKKFIRKTVIRSHTLEVTTTGVCSCVCYRAEYSLFSSSRPHCCRRIGSKETGEKVIGFTVSIKTW